MIEEKTMFVPLTDDKLFKETFGRPENIEFLEYLLEVYYHYPLGFLKDKLVVFYESPPKKAKYQDKEFRNDLRVTIDHGIYCNIEMYETFNKKAFQKSKSYIMRIYSTQLDVGKDYNEIKKVTQINFVNSFHDEMKFAIDEEIKNTLYLGNKKTSDDFEVDIVRLDLVRKVSYNEDDRFMNLLNFISAKTKEEREEIAKRSDMLMEINDWVNKYMTDDEWWRTYNDDYWNKKIYGEKGKNEEKVAIAKNLLNKLSIEEISETTGLSIEEIQKLKEN